MLSITAVNKDDMYNLCVKCHNALKTIAEVF